MAYSFKIRRRVEFSETDMAGIVHFSNFYRYMESVEHAFFRSLGLSIAPGGEIGWPRVHASFDFRKPLRFEEEFEVELLVKEKRARSLMYTIIVRKLDGAEVARGTLGVACIRKDPETGEMRATPIPDHIAALIDIAPAEAAA